MSCRNAINPCRFVAVEIGVSLLAIPCVERPSGGFCQWPAMREAFDEVAVGDLGAPERDQVNQAAIERYLRRMPRSWATPIGCCPAMPWSVRSSRSGQQGTEFA